MSHILLFCFALLWTSIMHSISDLIPAFDDHFKYSLYCFWDAFNQVVKAAFVWPWPFIRTPLLWCWGLVVPASVQLINGAEKSAFHTLPAFPGVASTWSSLWWSTINGRCTLYTATLIAPHWTRGAWGTSVSFHLDTAQGRRAKGPMHKPGNFRELSKVNRNIPFFTLQWRLHTSALSAHTTAVNLRISLAHPSSAILRWKFTLAETTVPQSMGLTCFAASSVRRAQPTIPLGSLLFTSSRCSQVCSTHQVPHSPLWSPENHPWHHTGAQRKAHRWPKMSKHCSKQAQSEDTETSGHTTREHLHQSWSRLTSAKLQKDTNKSSHKEKEEGRRKGARYFNCILLKPQIMDSGMFLAGQISTRTSVPHKPRLHWNSTHSHGSCNKTWQEQKQPLAQSSC